MKNHLPFFITPSEKYYVPKRSTMSKNKIYGNPHTSKLLRLTFLFLILGLICSPFISYAQYSSVPVTGFNADVVGDGAVGAGTNSTTADVDGANFIFVSTTFNPGPAVCSVTSSALPSTNLITSLISPALTYGLQPYNANNSLRLGATATGTLTLTTPISASNLYLLATSGSGSCNISVTINFTDLTNQVVTGTVNDWCSGTTPATTQFYRILRNATTCSGALCQYLYEVNLALDGTNYFKSIASIQVLNTAGGVLNVMAVGARAACATPVAQPTALLSTALQPSTISASFTDASTLPTGGYLVVRYPSTAIPTAPVNGTVYSLGQALGTGTVVGNGLTTSFTASGLTPSTSYSFYVYSYNAATTCGGPSYLTTAPLTGTFSTTACGTASGTIAIAPGLPNTVGGGFTSISSAMAFINSSGMGGSIVLELQSGYDGTALTETFPITFPLNACVSPTKTITIRPAASVSSPLSITSNNATATINVDGGTYITIDGRPGGIGTTSQLSIINTNNAGVAIQFINDAHHNVFRYCDVQGQNSSATSTALSGVIYFAGTNTSALIGNDYNTITNCDIHATAGSFPAMGICSYGNNVTTPVTSWNDSNTITNCNIYDFFSATLASAAIKLDGGSNAFTISNNRVYQTATRNYTATSIHRAFWLTTGATGACGFQVLNNFIGGNTSSGSGTYTMTSAAAILTNFWAMDINHTGLTHTSVQGNTITNISFSSSTAAANDLFRGISTGGTGNVDIGTVTGNIIGAATGTGAILLATTGNSSISYGIKSASTIDTVAVYNNIIGSITLTSATSTNATNFYGIGVTSGAFNFIVGNKIGSTSTNNSINASNPATTAQSVYGISVAAGTLTIVSGNVIANLNNGFTANTFGYTRGIIVSASTNATISDNIVRNLSTASTYTGTNTLAALIGIQMTSLNPASVTGNIIDSLVLTSTSTSAAIYIEGIVYSGTTTVTSLISRNFIHSLDAAAINPSVIMFGIDIQAGSVNMVNNMIRLGIKTDGTDITAGMIIRGIYINVNVPINIHHNSIYIGGAGVGTNAASTATIYRNTSVLGAQVDIRNNILQNDRSNATTGGKHYLMLLNNTTSLSVGNNCYFGSGSGFVFATSNGVDIQSYSSGWLNTDWVSSVSNPRFQNPTGTASTVDLHINPVPQTPVEGTGSLISTITDDYDGQARSSNTPVDIGADAGNFTGLPMSIDSTVVDQNSQFVSTGSTNQYVVRIRVYAKENFNPIQVNSFSLNTTGTTNVNDITNAKVFSTGSSGVFANATQYGTTVAVPSGAYSITGTTQLSSGVNYFWVTYDVKSTAIINNSVDVSVVNIALSGSISPAILNGNPSGSRTIKTALAGTYTIGSGQTYATIANAMNDLSGLGVSGPVIFTLTDPLYTLTDSVYVAGFAGASPVNTVTLMPSAANATGAIITSSSATSTFEINGASYFIIDGRPGGIGAAISVPNTTYLNIINTSVTGSAIRMNNDSRNNTIKYCDLQGVNNVNANLQGTSAGVVFIGSTNGTTGNDSNTIDNCNIHSTVSTAVLTMGVYSYGPASSSALIAPFNDYNTVSNCNIYDIYGGVNLSTGGIVVERGTNAWTFTGNSFFQTVSRTPVLTAGVVNRNIYISTTTTNGVGNGFTITGNYFGGTAPQCGGTALTSTTTGAFNNLHEGIYLSVNGGTTTNIKANTFTNLNISQAANAADLYHAIWVNHNGNVNIGGPSPADGNTIGSSTTTGAITLGSAGGTTPSHMILMSNGGGANSSTNILIQNNKVGGITLTGNGNSFTGIFCSNGATVTIDNNLIGSTTIANSINASNTGATAQFVRGINVPSAAAVLTITNNTIANLNNNSTATGTGTNGTNASISQTQGIYVIGTSTVGPIVTGNTVKNLSNASPMTSIGTAAVISGIAVFNTTAITPATISSNKIDSLVATSVSTTAAISPAGISYTGPTVVVNTIARNYVNNVDVVAANTGALIKGIEIIGGAVNAYNNMVRLGLHADGSDLTTSLVITGILKSGTGNNKFYHNSVYIGGTSVGTTVKNTAAFQRTATGLDEIRNNIFVNNRSNATTGGKHYQLLANASATLTANNNVYYGTGTGAVFASANGGTLDTTLYKAGWIVSDLNSIVGNPQFISATGPSATADLHIHASNPTPVEASGVSIALVTDDYDGQPRSTNTPSDIGADAGNFVQADLVGPTIGAFTLTNTSATTNRTFTANLSDNSGVATGGSAPRVYYAKGTGTPPSVFSSAAATLTSGTAINGQWNFTIVAADMGGLTLNDSVYYYIAAQDVSAGTYLSSAPAGATSSGTIPPPTLFSYKIVQGYAGTINVGIGQTYTSLTATGGIFDSINKGSLSGNVTLSITSDLLLEDGTVPLNQWAESGAGNYNISIVPNAATECLIAGNANVLGSGLIRFDGADRVKIDGRFAGSGRYLRFRNRGLSGATFAFLNDAHCDTLSYCFVEGVTTNTTTANILFGTTNLTTGSGNDSNGINNCFIGDTLGSVAASGRPGYGIISGGTVNFENSDNTIANNNFYNYVNIGVNVTGTGNGNNWNIIGNSFYNTMQGIASLGQTSINFAPGVLSVNNRIAGNFMGGSAPLCAGTAFINTSNTTWRGILVSTGTADSNYVQNNTIQNVTLTGIGAGVFTGIEVFGGLMSINGNTIGHSTTTNIIQTSLLGTVIGVSVNGATSIPYIHNNIIGNITSTGTTSSVGINGIRITNANTNFPISIKNNIIKGLTGATVTVSSSTSAIVGILSTIGGVQHNISNNTISNLVNSAAAATSVVGINISNSAAAGIVSSNLVYGLNNTSTFNTAQIVGIHLDAAYGMSVMNNMISLGYNVDSSAIISGIMDRSSATLNQVFYNTVLVSGNATSPGSTTSLAYRRVSNSGIDLRNNILKNTRTGGLGNYAIANANGILGWNANNNILHTSNSSQIGLWIANSNTLAQWKVASTFDSNSVSYNTLLVSNTDLHLSGSSIGHVALLGKPITGFTTDYDGQTRNASFPYIGADENTASPLPVKFSSFAATANTNDVLVTWTTASESNNLGFEVEHSVDGISFEKVEFVKGAGSSNKSITYGLTEVDAFVKTNSNVLYYRLKQIDFDGAITYSDVVVVTQATSKGNQLSLFPNPAVNSCTISFAASAATSGTILVSDIHGRLVSTQTVTAVKGYNSTNIDNIGGLQSGVYFVKVTINGNTNVLKLIKQ